VILAISACAACLFSFVRRFIDHVCNLACPSVSPCLLTNQIKLNAVKSNGTHRPAIGHEPSSLRSSRDGHRVHMTFSDTSNHTANQGS
jgi:hypothetical protein